MSQVDLFPNGYGTSVVCNEFSYGLELGVLKWKLIHLADGSIDKWWELCYDTPITGDTCGHLSSKQLAEITEDVKALPVCSKQTFEDLIRQEIDCNCFIIDKKVKKQSTK